MDFTQLSAENVASAETLAFYERPKVMRRKKLIPTLLPLLSGIGYSCLTHLLLFWCCTIWVLKSTATISWAELQQSNYISLILSNEPSESIENFADVEIVAPDGLPVICSTPEVAMTFDAPDLPALEAGAIATQNTGDLYEVELAPTLSTLLAAQDKTIGGGYEGRLNPTGKAKLLGTRGGSPETEQGVSRALAWIVAHQQPSGAWSLDHRSSACRGECTHAGTAKTKNGATALALLPLLGAGHTTEQGSYRETVQQGLSYLRTHAKTTPYGLDWHEGNMYAQALVAIALCENLAMTHDESFRSEATAAIRFIEYAQHEAGGWRYFPKQPGDMTVFGWQFMALESARRAGIEVSPLTTERALAFLESLQSADGTAFGYTHSAEVPSPTAIGTLCRFYAGYSRTDARILQSLQKLQSWGYSSNDMYFNFYTTQVMHHRQGIAWEQWNTQMKNHLLATQSQEGHATGSWHFPHEHAMAGGRLYNTALATLMLEVYYRHLPLFSGQMSSAQELTLNVR